MMKKIEFQPTPVEEPPLASGKEKRKRKLDEIVFGLSAAKEQKTFSDPLLSSPSSKKSQIPPSVSVTPASSMGSQSSASLSAQKPFSVTVTSVPGSNTSKFFFVFTAKHWKIAIYRIFFIRRPIDEIFGFSKTESFE